MLEQLMNRSEVAIDLAQAAGADDAWAWATRTRSVEYSFRDGNIETVKESTSRGLSIQLYVDGRYSTHSTTDLEPTRLASFIKEAVALTRALQPDPHRSIPDAGLFQNRPSIFLDLLDKQILAITMEQRLDWVSSMNERARADDRVISATSAVADEHTLLAGASSNGFSGQKESTMVQLCTEVTIQDEGERRPEGWHWALTRHMDDLPDPGLVGTEALGKALDRLGVQQGSSGRYSMVVDPQAASRLIRALLGPATALAVHRGRSFWKDRMGDEMFSTKLSIHDEPLIPRGLKSRLFDAEGISARTIPIVENGIASNLYVDTYYGKKTGLPPTTGSSSNRVIALGDRPLADLIKDTGEGVYVNSWLGGNSDPTTGDYSFGIRGHMIENGQIGRAVGEMNVSGNLVGLFQSLVALGNDPWPYSSTLTPTMVFENVEFSGS